jgi:hypothetical protein
MAICSSIVDYSRVTIWWGPVASYHTYRVSYGIWGHLLALRKMLFQRSATILPHVVPTGLAPVRLTVPRLLSRNHG